ncbi:hypothetical protein [Polluticaenibacter yanchengensis]|uniref:Nucleotidyl transferase AbiEii/AbiGii toxin family protein n=1 Tax=Polluticaenibacter yanchengensis TaxID=3014562 RepID=A0ABT4UR58_9BACT|nr:hypothetical protein [Chitinophagaceae bacterium LY-5]
MSQHQNIVRLKAIHHALGNIQNEVVYVGGAILSLYANQPILEVRATSDVDIIIEIVTYGQRAALEEKLRGLGFEHDIASGIICRFRYDGFIVDVMPTNDNTIGFHNIWYAEAFTNAVTCALDENVNIRIPTAAHYIATKLEAFKGRGQNDGYSSHDFEDIIFVLQTRSTIWAEINASKPELLNYLKTHFTDLYNNPLLPSWIEGCIDKQLDAAATNKILNQWSAFIKH